MSFNSSISGTSILPIALAGLALLTLSACGKQAVEDASVEVSETVLTAADVSSAKLDTIASGVLLSGPLEPIRSVLLKAQVDGTVGSLLVDRGSRVSRGQLLLTIDADGVREQAVSADAVIAAAKASVAVAEQQRDGSRILFSRGAISEIDLKAAEAQFEAASAELLSAQARAVGAKEMASRTRVVSPLDGFVSVRTVQAGEPVSNGAHLLTVVDTRSLELAGKVGVDIAPSLKVGMPVEFRISSDTRRAFTGKVARVDPIADQATRQVGVYVQLPNADRLVVAGQYATGRVLFGNPSYVVTIPSAAIKQRDGQDVVAVVDNGVISVRPVEISARDDTRGLVGISSGISEGARVIVMPGPGLSDGTRVRISTTASPSDSGRPSVSPTGGS